MSWQTELKSWMFPTSHTITEAPTIGQKAPETTKLKVGYDGKPTMMVFLRHCGCPFAEKTFKSLRELATIHPDIKCIAVSHSGKASTDRWLEALGGAGDIEVMVDEERELYARWGLGVSSFWHILNPWSMYSVYTLGKQENIWNRPTESGTRWQTSGAWAVDRGGIVRWGGIGQSASDMPDFEKALKQIGRQ